MRVGWLADAGNADGTVGGAELTAAEFRAAAPEGVEVGLLAPTELELVRELDVVCVFNCVTYPAEWAAALAGKPVLRYWNDVAPHGDPHLTRWLVGHATNVFTSPLHQARFPWLNGGRPNCKLVAPPVGLQRFKQAADHPGQRAGAVAVGPWMNPGKAPHLAAEWARQQGVELHFYGGGPFAPATSQPVGYHDMPEVLARYQTFVHLPSVLEPFGRGVVEAWAAGCQIVVNRLVGSRWWIEEAPDRLERSAAEFWALVANAAG